MKPVALLDTVLETTPFAETVYDPFVGSGTKIIAAERQGRAWLGDGARAEVRGRQREALGGLHWRAGPP